MDWIVLDFVKFKFNLKFFGLEKMSQSTIQIFFESIPVQSSPVRWFFSWGWIKVENVGYMSQILNYYKIFFLIILFPWPPRIEDPIGLQGLKTLGLQGCNTCSPRPSTSWSIRVRSIQLIGPELIGTYLNWTYLTWTELIGTY